MRTVTFYSYKGGTGRSLLLANLATLVARLGKRVVALDLDLEAPGLHYKLCPGKDKPLLGAVDWLSARRLGHEPPELADAALTVPVPAPLRDGGSMTLIPAGRAPSGDYFELVQSLHLDEWLLADGVDAFLELTKAIESNLTPDYLFIDSRTGVTASNAVTTRVLADAVVVLTLDSEEQLEGTRAVLRTLQPLTSLRTGEALDLHVVHGRSADDDRALPHIRSYLTEPSWPVQRTVALREDHCHSVRHDPDVARAEFLSMSRKEPHAGPLHLDHWAIANALFSTLMDTKTIASVVAAAYPEDFDHWVRVFDTRPQLSEWEHFRSLESAREAVDLYRALAGTDPANHIPNLARTLINYATLLAENGQRGEALHATDEVVNFYRTLANANPVAYTPDLAISLYNYAILLADVGRHEEALDAAHEALTLYQALDIANPRAFAKYLARATDSYYSLETGRLSEPVVAPAIRATAEDRRLMSRSNLASAYESAGELGRAIALYEATLEDSVRTLGPDHPDTLGARNNLAYAYWSAGDLGRAIPLYEATLEDSVRTLGPDHPDTLGARNNLAGAYRSVGDLGRAIPLFETTLQDREWLLGADHPDTLMSRNNLASAYRSVGDLGRAIPLFETTLQDRERVLGPDHPDTLILRNNLASAYWENGRKTEALVMFEESAEVAERLFGVDHGVSRRLVESRDEARRVLGGPGSESGDLT